MIKNSLVLTEVSSSVNILDDANWGDVEADRIVIHSIKHIKTYNRSVVFSNNIQEIVSDSSSCRVREEVNQFTLAYFPPVMFAQEMDIMSRNLKYSILKSNHVM